MKKTSSGGKGSIKVGKGGGAILTPFKDKVVDGKK